MAVDLGSVDLTGWGQWWLWLEGCLIKQVTLAPFPSVRVGPAEGYSEMAGRLMPGMGAVAKVTRSGFEGGNPATARSIKDIPIRIRHRAADPIVRVEFTRGMVSALKKARGNIK